MNISLLAGVLLLFIFAAQAEKGPREKRASIVFVHGAFHGPSSWDEVRTILLTYNITTHAVVNPSAGYNASELGDLYDDTTNLVRTIRSIKGPVVVVGHSYGGAVISNGALAPNVQHLIYLAAVVPQHGKPLLPTGSPSGFQEHPAQGTDKAYLCVDPIHAVELFYNDFTLEQIARTVPALKKQSLASISQNATMFAYKHVPSTYILTLKDHAVDPVLQRKMAKETHMKIVEIDSSHSPFISKPFELAMKIVKISFGDFADS